ncbi:MAG: hypothetical protein LBU15_01345 [Rickettsiales bacterium]|jgi:hypothetical protein|nr:hypothetical protein [Rickettsiales bacterium]
MSEKTEKYWLGESERAVYNFNEKTGLLEQTCVLSKSDMEKLREDGVLGNNTDFGYHTNQLFLEKAIDVIKDRYPNVSEEIPIGFYDESENSYKQIREQMSSSATGKPELAVIYDDVHTVVTLNRPVADGRVEVYVMDSYFTQKNPIIENIYSDSSKYTVRYSVTPHSLESLERRNKIQDEMNQLESQKGTENYDRLKREMTVELLDPKNNPGIAGIQFGAQKCMVFTMAFIDEWYKTIGEKMENTKETDPKKCLDSIVDRFETKEVENPYCSTPFQGSKFVEANVGKKLNAFVMPNFLLKYGDSEQALDAAVKHYTAKKDIIEGESEKIKGQVVAFKKKREQEVDRRLAKDVKPLEKGLDTLLAKVENLKKAGGDKKNREAIEKYEAKIEEKLKANDIEMEPARKDLVKKLRDIFSPSANLANKAYADIIKHDQTKTGAKKNNSSPHL